MKLEKYIFHFKQQLRHCEASAMMWNNISKQQTSFNDFSSWVCQVYYLLFQSLRDRVSASSPLDRRSHSSRLGLGPRPLLLCRHPGPNKAALPGGRLHDTRGQLLFFTLQFQAFTRCFYNAVDTCYNNITTLTPIQLYDSTIHVCE